MTAPISVVMPTYNGAAFVEEALRSVFRQSLLPAEMIVVDDCSVDATRDIVTALSRHAPAPLRLMVLAHNSGGPARPLNHGIAAARGEFIAVLDQDDVYLPNKLKEQHALLAAEPALSFVFSLCGRLDRPDQTLADAHALQAVRQGGCTVKAGDDVLQLLLTHGNFMLGYPGVLFRRAAWERKGGVDEALAIASDYEFFCWLCLQGGVGFLDRVHYLRRLHAGNVCNQVEATRLEAYRVQSRYIQREPWLLADATLSAAMRERLFDLAYFLRQRGAYREALRLYRFSVRAWGWEARTLKAMGKLLPHWARRVLLSGGRKPPEASQLRGLTPPAQDALVAQQSMVRT